MTSIHRAAPVTSSKPSAPKGLTAADEATASQLKGAINELMMRVRVVPTPVAQQPKTDPKTGVTRAPNGHALFKVVLETPPKGTAGGQVRTALVDPLTNTFYVRSSGGAPGPSTFTGPLGLPVANPFKGKSYSAAQMKLLEAAAVKQPKPVAFHATPTVQRAAYSPGMGARPPAGVYGGPRVDVTATYPNITYQPTWKVKLDEKTKTMTVTLDASSGIKDSKSMTRPVDLSIPVPRPATVGGTYTLVVKDHAGKTLKTSKFQNVLPA